MPYKDPERKREHNRRYQSEWAKRNRARVKGYRLKAQAQKRAVVAEAKAGGCVQCGELDPICLDFHHEGDKTHNVADLAHSTGSLARLAKEISECVVLCSNCHRKYHAGRFALGDSAAQTRTETSAS